MKFLKNVVRKISQSWLKSESVYYKGQNYEKWNNEAVKINKKRDESLGSFQVYGENPSL